MWKRTLKLKQWRNFTKFGFDGNRKQIKSAITKLQ